MASIRKLAVAVVLAGILLYLYGTSVVGVTFAVLAVVLVLITTTWTVVLAGVGVAGVFFLGEGLTRLLEQLFPDPRFGLLFAFLVGLLAGKLEETVLNRSFD